MKHYLKLVHFEINRFLKIYVALLVIAIVTQITGLVIVARNLVNDFVQMGAFFEYSKISFDDFIHTYWFLGPVVFVLVALFFYVFLIWYYDWLGKSSFIHRLLILPSSRMNVFFSKATAIFLMVLGLFSVQIILLFTEKKLFELIVPKNMLLNMSVREMVSEGPVAYFIPGAFINFLINYGLVFTVIIVLFTAILLERSFKWIGIVLGVGYVAVVFGLLYAPIRLLFVLSFIYVGEFFILMSLSLLFVLIGSVWLSNYLINKKVSI